ncbi:uncharacterized protein Nmag_1558 [Natrialba magadii ATCC 43099]|uniref:Uncharacterized protein n=1 Tax=Natrialba magadii (strain ATCC 43099 / DSM 3394 / CCM 3739 / CIP 104546 / IAM 13178 / JCM 8861 / NBRC 102185 / NCIMB 2190 / MS3) TaxID=547559 RepID=D3SU76_NATMM|nr:hypothetical protein [Natrialba magadii]ADD05134.2 uncharacterized protein Nmag_1558 [Natrialba magadii ATCC 43099]ELY23172.1 hypothetical protein C500_20321 [Natrialba magadii ATCC 43099]
MDRTDVFLALITFLLAALVYEVSDPNTPGIIAVPVLLLLYSIPIYLGAAFVFKLAAAESPIADQAERGSETNDRDS